MYETTDYPGINYAGSHSTTNMDVKTGVRYGVIPANDVIGFCDDAEAHYTPRCPECGNEVKPSKKDGGGYFYCSSCKDWYEEEECCAEEADYYYVKEKGLCATQSGDDPDVFITSSPYFTYAQFCSPCAPGACYLRHPLNHADPNNRAYCFGHDWFEGGKAPYPVYSAKTGKLVE